ncbi:DNA gyrase inhibitor YacG [Steroidobacter cummioxidans]|uniref:DNA gyrase inhibitor YacG n=1 Tax=Steroidobacter cummioxidans TaxID=1803913 RepID=UPI000E30D567|nr:DNA gyrase inhibitor YacG [Steroidobacter cummioxidans]
MTVVRCPTCDRPVEWTEASRWRPFCSERCKLIDLGAWAAEKHAIPGAGLETEDGPKRDRGERDDD